MKKLVDAKITLIDPEKKEEYDNKYTPQDLNIPEGEKLFLATGKRLSEGFIVKIKKWIEEFREIEILDNFYITGKKWIELREALVQVCKDIPDEDSNSYLNSKYYKLILTRETTSSLKDKLKHFIPDHIWRMDGVNPNRIFFKQSLIQYFGNWKNSGDEYFVEGHYKIALFCYQRASNNAVILEKARQLYKKNEYEASLLYYRYLFDIDRYKLISINMLLKILLNFEDKIKYIFEVLEDKLANFIPYHIWTMDGVNPNRIFFKQSLIQYFGNWKNSGDEYFVEEHYKTALFCYQRASNNAVILEKALQLYKKKKYEASLLYYRYLFDIDRYKPISTLMLLKIILKNFKEDISKGIFDVLKDKLAHLIPVHIWKMDGVDSNRIFFKQSLIQYFGNWKNSGDEYFEEEHYKTALFCYQRASNNAVILDKARQLYKKNEYEASLLYYRYLFDIDAYKPISTLMSLKILLKNSNEDIFNIALHAAYVFVKEAKIHKFLYKLLLGRNMIHEAREAIQIAIGLGSGELVEKLRDLTKKCDEKDYNNLQTFVYESEFEKIANYIKEYRCLAVINRLYTELTKCRDMSKLPAKYRATLSILRGASLQLENKYNESLKCFREALLLFPFEGPVSAVSILLNNEYIKPSIQQLLDEIKLNQIKLPTNHGYVEMLKRTTVLRTVIRYERNILNNKLSELEKAMLYIDLTMACGHPYLMANNFLVAAYFLLKGIEAENDLATKYAYRNTICDLCGLIYSFSHYMDPSTLTHFVKLSLNLMNSSHELLRASFVNNKKGGGKQVINLINPMQEHLLSYGNNLISTAIKVNPLMDMPITLSGDILYIKLVGNEFLESFYNFMIKNNPSHPWNHLYNYYLFEGSWINWADINKFQTYRENAMSALLKTKGWTLNDIQKIMSMDIINRDADGWWDIGKPWINLPSQNFDSVDGVIIDIEKGEFQFLLTKSESGSGLINWDDIRNVCENDITASFFTLDQPNFHLHSHPFQKIKYGPKQLNNTNYLMTLLAADYLLKMLSMGTEVSAKEPFLFRDSSESLTQLLPEYLRDAVKSIDQRKNGSTHGSAHRFWIESGKLPYNIDVDDNKIKITFEYCPMIIKKHLMKSNADGKLVDDEDDEEDEKDEEDRDDEEDEKDEDDEEEDEDEDEDKFHDCKEFATDNEHERISAEKEFANDFTKNYDELGYYFPVLLRLRELLKIMAITILIKRIYQSRLSKLSEIFKDTEKIDDLLLNVTDNIPFNELNIFNHDKTLSDLLKMLREPGLVIKKEMAKLNQFAKFCHDFGFNLDSETKFEYNDENECVWVPAAFGKRDNIRVYGGVLLTPKLVPAKQSKKKSENSGGGGKSSKSGSNCSGSGKNGPTFCRKGHSNASGGFGSDERKKKIKRKGKDAAKHCGQMARKFNNHNEGQSKIGKTLENVQFKIGKFRYSSRKDAYEDAKRFGGGNEPQLHYHDERGSQPHYHPTFSGNNGKLHKIENGSHYYFPRGK